METRKNGKRRKHKQDSIASALGPMQSRGQVDGETQKYYSEISELLDKITDQGEITALCSNALEEAHGKEMQLSCHPKCGRVIEKLLQTCGNQSLTFLENCLSSFVSMAMDPSGSHVLEALFKSLGEALNEDSKLVSSIEDILHKIFQILQVSLTETMKNRYGSHVLRTLIFFLAGLAFDPEKDTLARKLGRASTMETKNIRHQGFPDILQQFKRMILEIEIESLRDLGSDTFASLVFQTLLKALHATEQDTTDLILKLLNIPGEKNVDVPSDQILEMMENQNSSHLMEVILEVASEELYKKLLKRIFLNNLNRLATHQYSNFVVQTLVACARQQKQVNLIMDELGKSFDGLIKNKRGGVIVSLLGACSRFNTRQQEICRAVATAVCPAGTSRDNLVPRLLHLDDYDSEIKHRKLSTLGCAMLQAIFTFSQDCSQQYYRSISMMGSTELLEAAKDQTGCYVIEAFLTSPASPRQKNTVIERFKGRFADLAMDSKSCYIVTKCYDGADIKLKEAIVCDLLPFQQNIAKTKQAYIFKKFNVSKYAMFPDKWRSSERRKQVTKDDYANLFEGESNTKTGKKRKKAKTDNEG